MKVELVQQKSQDEIAEVGCLIYWRTGNAVFYCLLLINWLLHQ
jgi:hypothetical protein